MLHFSVKKAALSTQCQQLQQQTPVQHRDRHLLSMSETLSSIPSTERKKKKLHITNKN